MFESIKSFTVKSFSTYMPDTIHGHSRIKILPNGDILLIANDEDDFTFHVFSDNGNYSFSVEYYGKLAGVTYHEGYFWLEFRDILTAYMEEYVIVKANVDVDEIVFSTNRESYMHDMPYHHLFVKDGMLFLNLIRHNRLHKYQIEKDGIEEIDVMEGGKWYLCGAAVLCQAGHSLELYDSSLDISHSIEHDQEIDDIKFAESANPPFFAATLTDGMQEDTTLIIYHSDTHTMHVAYIEHSVADMGVSAGRVWLNPHGFNHQQNLGGCMVYDRFAWPLYIHMRTKSIGVIAQFGAYPPPFHRTEGIHPLPEMMTLVCETSRLLVLDYNCRGIQEIPVPNSECFAISESGGIIAVLQVNPLEYPSEDVVKHKNVKLDIYKWNSESEDKKIIEMKFQR